jgi:hypothetical protein
LTVALLPPGVNVTLAIADQMSSAVMKVFFSVAVKLDRGSKV